MPAPLITRDPPRGRPADRMAAGVAAIALLGAIGMTAWFFLGFFENDPQFVASSSAFLLSMGLGAFAIVPGAVVMRLAWGAFRRGFRVGDGVWTLVLAGPWIGLSAVLLTRAPIPALAPIVAGSLAILLCLWALIGLALSGRDTSS